MERLTRRLYNGRADCAYCFNEFKKNGDCMVRCKVRLAQLDRLAELEDKLESGELVEVIRCKDCKHFRTQRCAAKHERALMDFCNCGERK